ncbi:MAG: hypothetical protein AB7O43_18510 [Hyphomicrobiaceae bacterium]
MDDAQSKSGEDSRKAEESATARREVRDSYEDLRADVTNLTDAVKKLANAEFGGVASDARQAAEQGMASVESSIRKNPTQAALIAAGVGFLVGLLVIR